MSDDSEFENELDIADDIIFQTFRNVAAIFSNTRQPVFGIFDAPESEVVTKGKRGELTFKSAQKTLAVKSSQCPPLSSDLTIKIGEKVYFPVVEHSFDNGSGHYVIALGDEPLPVKDLEVDNGWR